jgi:serine phosphatase RsbU (regulator of sigma subunit)
VGVGRYPTKRFKLARGDSLALYTDGLIEEGRADTDQRTTQLMQTLNEHSSLDCGALADHLIHAPDASPLVDDVAVLVVKWTGDPRRR